MNECGDNVEIAWVIEEVVDEDGLETKVSWMIYTMTHSLRRELIFVLYSDPHVREMNREGFGWAVPRLLAGCDVETGIVCAWGRGLVPLLSHSPLEQRSRRRYEDCYRMWLAALFDIVSNVAGCAR
jgi:hypothetical protein